MSLENASKMRRHVLLIVDDPGSQAVSVAKMVGGHASYFTIVLRAGANLAVEISEAISEWTVDAISLLTTSADPEVLPPLPLFRLTECGQRVREGEGEKTLLEALADLRESLGVQVPIYADTSMDF